MINSLWRNIHVITTLCTGIFILLASLTGIILAIEPMLLNAYSVSGQIEEDVTLQEFKELLEVSFLEIYAIEIDAYSNIKVEGISEKDENEVYVRRDDARIVKPPRKLATIFEFSRDLHRSLFLKTPGRILMGIASFGLILLIISGINLQIKRAGGWKNILKITKMIDFKRDAHALLSKILLIPIFIIAVSGFALSLLRFLPESNDPNKVTHHQNAIQNPQSILLKDVKKVTFAIDQDELTKVELHDNTILLDHKDEIQMVSNNAPRQRILNLNFFLHTGEGSTNWAIVLLITAIVMVFLSVTGFIMLVSKYKTKALVPTVLADVVAAEKIILVGSETGNTWRFAHAFKQAYEMLNEPIQVLSLDKLPPLEGNKTIFILTSTYGDGDAPENAKNTLNTISDKIRSAQQINFAILGFGSRAYPEFCAFAETLRQKISEIPNTTEVVPYATVNNQSVYEYLEWIKSVNTHLKQDLVINTDELKPQRKKNLDTFTIKERRQEGETFIMTIVHQCFVWINSGDLIGIYPPECNIERYYSIAVIGKNKLVLVIKKTGVCSNYLADLVIGDTFQGFIKQNSHFYMPQSDEKVMLISNGTGIAPFLGMIQNTKNASLYWGGRYFNDFELFKPYFSDANITTVFSKEANRAYVQDALSLDESGLIATIQSSGTIMICGSITMMKGVMNVIEKVIEKHGLPSIAQLKENGKILVDCY
jgi:sulfite reductase (NADPH) flavoprotein alpha-component